MKWIKEIFPIVLIWLSAGAFGLMLVAYVWHLVVSPPYHLLTLSEWNALQTALLGLTLGAAFFSVIRNLLVLERFSV